MKILILGGTRFVGRHILELAAVRGHTLTLFHRGKTQPAGLPDAEHILGDREGDLSALQGRAWDAVIDTSGYVPSAVRAAAQMLRAAAPYYLFISTISAYADSATPGADESYPLGSMPAEQAAAVTSASQVTGENYGPLKVLCEAEVQTAFADRTCVVRPGLIVGPYDASDRFTYWVRRVAQGGDVLVPQALDARWQVIDARDLAAWALDLTEQRITGVFNATGPEPEHPLTMAAVLDAAAAQRPAVARRLISVSDAFLKAEGLDGWQHLPLVLPADSNEHAGFYYVDCRRAIAAGLTFRPIADTVRDTLMWDAMREGPLAIGMSPQREAEALAKWRVQPG